MSFVKARKQSAAEKQSATPLGFFIALHRVVHPSEAILPQSAPVVRTLHHKDPDDTVTLTATQHSSHPDSIFHLLDRVHVTHPYLCPSWPEMSAHRESL